MLDLHALRLFRTVAQELNFRRAAERLGMSQPPLSRAIQDLERRIGARLLDRTTHRVSLTASGLLLLREADALLAQAEQTARCVRHATADESRRFTVGHTALAMHTCLPPVVSCLRERHPDVEFRFVELSTEDQLSALAQAEVDLGFIHRPAHAPELELHDLHSERMQLTLPQEHRLANSPRIELAEVAGETIIMHRRSEHPAIYDAILSSCARAGFTPRLRDLGPKESCLALVGAGYGIHFMAAGMGHARPPGLALLEVLDHAPTLVVAAALRADDGSMVANTVRDILAGGAGAPRERE
jgi:LysR family transcriptional regulator, benzoate and cis,cis-muconate-responsive activator of ben and cat genes